ncbi:MAG: phosphatase PAP2 family protein [Lactobacillus sp.]|nr:phosphatase PAP2 family protein [Lactobacillus sp.]MCH4068372.1 phosphatase PAP2 family protein [Lactobacillus sp.]MCI1304385.1 phosphatase PAP2 family protein [Lactobacillus sp.]MCI1330371.1 phosphatase PAP2 family protein [Lactobacillus sp.]MCI1359120.1 phosphatase PAP2 family protein [Lactobacillus sp.]
MMKKNYVAMAIGLPVTLILMLSVMLQAGWIGSFDRFFQHSTQLVPNLQDLMLKITALASPKMNLVWMALIAVILWIKNQRPLALNIVLLLISVDAVGLVIKHVVKRARPVQHLTIDDGYSFPSGHVLGMATIVLWLILILVPIIIQSQTTRTWVDILLVVGLLVVMVSRVYVYAHYPSDVCGSVAVATMWFGIFEWAWRKLTPRTKKNDF